jgi:hypothetical protein
MTITRKEVKGTPGEGSSGKDGSVKWEENETALRKASKDG